MLPAYLRNGLEIKVDVMFYMKKPFLLSLSDKSLYVCKHLGSLDKVQLAFLIFTTEK